jgi:hypothetical protein
MRMSPLWDHVSSIALNDTGATVARRRCRGWRLAPPGAPPCCVHVPLAGSRPLRWRTTMRIVFVLHVPLAGSRPLRWRTTMRILFVLHVPLAGSRPLRWRTTMRILSCSSSQLPSTYVSVLPGSPWVQDPGGGWLRIYFSLEISSIPSFVFHSSLSSILSRILSN